MELSLSILAAGKVIGAGSATCGVIGAGAGTGLVSGSLVLSVSRNPNKEARLIQLTLSGFALAEAMGSLAITMAFLILYS